jgi:hypothetical protein
MRSLSIVSLWDMLELPTGKLLDAFNTSPRFAKSWRR